MKRKIIMVPIEPLDMRYSIEWEKWFRTQITKNGEFDVLTVYPTPLSDNIKRGAFLDVCGTNYYKALQLQEMSKMLYDNKIRSGDIFFFHDAWFPGMEMLAYMRDSLKLDFKITGCLHAGTYDHTDFISKMGMGVWGRELENSWFTIYDKLFVATNYHKTLIRIHRRVEEEKIKVTGFPLYFKNTPFQRKEKIVVFPHRLTEDKQPKLFDELTERLKFMFPDWKFIKTQEVKRSKQEYFDILQKSAIAVSYATHENWGIGMQEAVLHGCLPVVPDRLSYKEMYPSWSKYKDTDEATNKVISLIEYFEQERMYMDTEYIRILINTIKQKGKEAIPKIIKELHGI